MVATARSDSGVGSAPIRRVPRLAGSNVAIPEALASCPPPITYSLPADDAAAASWIATGSRPAVRTAQPRRTEIVAVEEPDASKPPHANRRLPTRVTPAPRPAAAG